MKICPKCLQAQPEGFFNWKIKGVRLSSHCKSCSRAYVKKHYDQNKAYYIKKARKRNIEVLKQSHAIVWEFLGTHHCVDCGESDILVLEFDHRDRLLKNEDVSLMVKKTSSIDRLMQEISKCEIRCANCHRRKTALEEKNWKTNMHP